MRLASLARKLAIAAGLVAAGCSPISAPTVTASRSLASFDHSIPVSGCANCHAAQRPTTPVGTPSFDHTSNGGTNDCILCHTANVGKTWAGGQFTHSPLPTSCVTCHSAERPTSSSNFTVAVSASNTFDFTTHGGSTDCKVCHTAVANFKVQSDWAPGTYSHPATLTACSSCHGSNQWPVSTGPFTSASGKAITTFNHQTEAVSDCYLCHQAALTNVSSGTPNYTWIHTGDFTHTMSITSCTTCHSSGQWPTTSAPAGGFTSAVGGGAVVAAFNHATDGTGDCISCHAAAQSNMSSGSPSYSWTSTGTYAHSSSLTNCSTCHTSAQWPTSNGPFTDADGNAVATFEHTTQAVGDCSGCHRKALTNVSSGTPSYSWVSTGLLYPDTLAAILPSSTATSTNVSVQTASMTWTGTSISTASTSTVSVPQTMYHHAAEVSSTLLSNCATCHDGAASGSYFPGYYHERLVAPLTQPTTCSDCHGAGTLYQTGGTTNGMPAGLVGPVGNARTPATPEMNHFAQTWSLTGGTWNKTGTSIVTQDCGICHNQPGFAWNQANFHTSLAAASGAQPTSCLDCHANNRPSGAVPATPSAITPTKFDHTSGMGDCASCHTPPSNTTATTPPSEALWATGVFHATAGAQSSCSTCHAGQRPVSASGWLSATYTNAPFNYANHGNGMDCVTCHTPATYASMSGWEGGFYQHSATATTTCNTCHAIPSPTWYSAATASGVAGGFNHNGVGDCAGCHTTAGKSALTNIIAQGASPANSAWTGTGVGTPTGLVGNQNLSLTEYTLNSSTSPITYYNQVSSVSSSPATLPLEMLHSSVNIPAAENTGSCTTCHSATSVANSYKGGLFHTNPATNSLWATQPTNCSDCHTPDLPTGIVGSSNKYLNHAAMLSNGKTVIANASDCSLCHTVSGGVGNWSVGKFHATLGGVTPTTCTACHDQDVQSIVSTVTQHMNHSSTQVKSDCSVCHAQPTSAQMSAAGYPIQTPSLWSGGVYHAKIGAQPTACNDCHTSERPSTTTQSGVDNAQPTAEYMNHSSTWASGDCYTCHAKEVTTLPANASPTAWSKTDSFHTGVTAGVTSCQECHGLTNGNGSVAGTGNTLPASPTASSTNSAVGTVGATITPYFNSPAAGQPVPDMISHQDGNVSAKDCNLCHTVPPASAGADYAQWKAGKFHANVTSVNTSTGKCVNCHYNVMPNASFSAYNHTTLISSSGTIPVPGSTDKLTTDCSGCHVSNIGTNWLGASAASPHTGSFLQSASCVTCHVSGGPLSYSGSVSSGTAVGMPGAGNIIYCTDSNGAISGCSFTPPGTIQSGGSTYTLTFYHIAPASVTGSQGSVTLKASYNLSATACIYCHGTAANTVANPTGTDIILAAPSAGATGWGGGTMGYKSGTSYNHYLSPTSFTYTAGSGITASSGGTRVGTCSACHEYRRPSGHKTGQDCAGCHSPGSSFGD